MNSSVGFGGITLIIAAVVWLMIFVPGYAKRSQVRESASLVKEQHKAVKRATPLTQDEQLRRLINTQRSFSVLFALFLLGTIASALAAVTDSAWWIAAGITGLIAAAALFIQRAAGQAASKIAADRHRSKQLARGKAQKAAPTVQNREWTPNPLPAPLQQPTVGELSQPIADVIQIQKPKASLSGSEIDAILARRRAI